MPTLIGWLLVVLDMSTLIMEMRSFFLKHGAEPWRQAIFNLGIIWCFVSILCEPLDDHGGEVVFWVFGNFNFSSKLL